MHYIVTAVTKLKWLTQLQLVKAVPLLGKAWHGIRLQLILNEHTLVDMADFGEGEIRGRRGRDGCYRLGWFRLKGASLVTHSWTDGSILKGYMAKGKDLTSG